MNNKDLLFKYIKEYFSIDKIIKYVISNFFYFLSALLLIIFYKKIYNFLISKITTFYKKVISDKGIRTFFTSITKFALHFILLFIILNLLGVNFTGIFAIVGALSLVLGFAFKEIMENVFGGLILLAFKPFKVGDFIEFKSFVGEVKKIEIFYTTLTTPQNEFIIIPNGNIINNEIRNLNVSQHRRLDIKVGVGYDSDIKLVKKLLNDMIEAKKDELFYLDIAAPLIGMFEIGASTLNFDVRVYVREGKYLDARYYLYETIKAVFDENNIELPYDILDVNIKK